MAHAAAEGGQAIRSRAEFVQEPRDLARYWSLELDEADKHEKKWRERAAEVIKRYRDEERAANALSRTRRRRYNVLYANVETLKPGLYQGTPEVVVRRRFLREDPLSRACAEVLERLGSYLVDTPEFDAVMRAARDDNLLPGRGVVWVRYVPRFKREMQTVPVTARPGSVEIVMDETTGYPRAVTTPPTYFGPEGQEVPQDRVRQMAPGQWAGEIETDVLVDETVVAEHVSWKDYRESPAANYEKVRWIARRVMMDYDQVAERFGPEVAETISYSSSRREKDGTKDVGAHDMLFQQAEIWEVWDKVSRKVVWVSRDYADGPLDMRDDWIELKHFFPQPKPLQAIQTPDTRVPIPEYCQYQDQAEELDKQTARIARLTDALRANGLYPGTSKDEVAKMFEADGELIPVTRWQDLMEKGGAKGIIEWMPLGEIMQTINSLYGTRQHVKTDMYEITGISDILRGQTQASETLGAQRMKAQSASLRLRERQASMAEFARATIEIMVEMAVTLFDLETVRKITGVDIPTAEEKAQRLQQTMMQARGNPQIAQQAQEEMLTIQALPTWEEVMQTLRDDRLRCYVLDVDTDETLEADEDKDKQRRIEFANALGALFNAMAPLVQSQALPFDAAKEILLFVVRSFRAGRRLEHVLEQLRPPPMPDPNQPTPEERQQLMEIRSKQEASRERMMHESMEKQRDRQFDAGQEAQDRQTDVLAAVLPAAITAEAKVAGDRAKASERKESA